VFIISLLFISLLLLLLLLFCKQYLKKIQYILYKQSIKAKICKNSARSRLINFHGEKHIIFINLIYYFYYYYLFLLLFIFIIVYFFIIIMIIVLLLLLLLLFTT
jgi:hypothetical protein